MGQQEVIKSFSISLLKICDSTSHQSLYHCSSQRRSSRSSWGRSKRGTGTGGGPSLPRSLSSDRHNKHDLRQSSDPNNLNANTAAGPGTVSLSNSVKRIPVSARVVHLMAATAVARDGGALVVSEDFSSDPNEYRNTLGMLPLASSLWQGLMSLRLWCGRVCYH